MRKRPRKRGLRCLSECGLPIVSKTATMSKPRARGGQSGPRGARHWTRRTQWGAAALWGQGPCTQLRIEPRTLWLPGWHPWYFTHRRRPHARGPYLQMHAGRHRTLCSLSQPHRLRLQHQPVSCLCPLRSGFLPRNTTNSSTPPCHSCGDILVESRTSVRVIKCCRAEQCGAAHCSS